MKVFNFRLDGKIRNETGQRPFMEFHEKAQSPDNCIFVNPEGMDYGYFDGILIFSAKIFLPADIGKLILVGISNFGEEYESIKKAKLYTMKEISFEGLEETCNAVMAASREYKRLLLSISLDVLDRAFYPKGSIGGMTTRQLIYMIQRLKLVKNILAVQILGEDEELTKKIILELA